MEKEIKVALIGAFPYNPNRGVGALTFSVLHLLQGIQREKNIPISVSIINPEYGNKDVDTIFIGNETCKFQNLFPINFFSVKDICKFFIQKKRRRTLKYYRKIDFVMNLGAGDSFSDIYGKRRFRTFNDQNKMAFLFKKELILMPQTIGPFKDGKIKKEANSSIEKARMVLARDKQSFDYVLKNTRQQNVFELIDMAFFMPCEKQQFSYDRINVGLNVSALLWHGGYTRNNQFGLKVDYQELIRDIIRYFLSNPEVRLHLVSHAFSADPYHIENDYTVSRQLCDEYQNKSLILAPFFTTPIVAKNYISGLEFFAGSRMHATIAAFSSGVPVYPLAYSRKFNGLFTDSLDYKFMGDMVNSEHDAIIDGLKVAFNNRIELKNIIEYRMNITVAERIKLLKQYTTEFLGLAD